MTVLLVEPDDLEAQRLIRGLEAEGFACERVRSGQEALRRAPSAEALVAELVLPDLGGLDLVRALRSIHAGVPVIFHAALGGPSERVQGLDAGADDFLLKPCTPAELAARLRAVQRRRSRPERTLPVKVADLVWEPVLRRVSRAGRRLDLTPKEYALIALLLDHRGEVVSRERMAEALWSLTPGHTALRSPSALDAQIRRLRAKLDAPFFPPLLHTIRGQGMVLEAGAPDGPET